MKLFVSLAYFLLFQFADLIAQNPSLEFNRTYTYGFEHIGGMTISETKDSGYIIGGYHSLTFPPENYFLMKTDANGDTIWTKVYDNGGLETASSALQTSDGGFAIVGSTDNGEEGPTDIWLVRTDQKGDIIWTKAYGDSTTEVAKSIFQTLDGGFIITGYARRPSNPDILFLKIDKNGNLMWERTFGGSGFDVGRRVIQSSDGGMVVSGHKHFVDSNQTHLWIIKTDVNGDSLWSKLYQNPNSSEANSIEETFDGGFIIAGIARNVDDRQDIWLLKTDSGGDTTWTRTYNHSHLDFPSYATQTSDSGFIITSTMYESNTNNFDGLIIRTNASGDTLWTKTFGCCLYDDRLAMISQTQDGAIIAVGHTDSDSSRLDGVWLLKLREHILSIDDKNYSKDFNLSQNHPNPFNPLTTIEYSIPSSDKVSLIIYNLLGEEVTRLVDGHRPAGNYSTTWDASNVATGIYFYRLQVGEFVETKKMVLLK